MLASQKDRILRHDTSASASSRTHSLASGMMLADDNSYDLVDRVALYELVLKIMILDYVTEARFRTPIEDLELTKSRSPTRANEKIPSYLIASLESRLKAIALKKNVGPELDETTRRSFLSFYSELLDLRFRNEVSKNGTFQYLLMKFVSCASKEVAKVGTVAPTDISGVVFIQATKFVNILESLVTKDDKRAEAVILTLRDAQQSFKPSGHSSSSTLDPTNARYRKPSFRVADMDQTKLALLQELFNVDLVKLQQDVFKLKDYILEKTLIKDIEQINFYTEKDLGLLNPRNFQTMKAYNAWKKRSLDLSSSISNKYKVPPSMKLLAAPPLPNGLDYYMIPSKSHGRSYLVILMLLCLQHQHKNTIIQDTETALFSKPMLSIISTCANIWLQDYSTRAVCLYTAAHLSGILKDDNEGPHTLGPVNMDATKLIFLQCKRLVEEIGKLDWEDKHTWAIKDQEEWTKNLTFSYNESMYGIKQSLEQIFNPHAKPKFGPFLMLLGDFLESDCLFPLIAESGLTKKWEKKLSKTLMRTSESRYAQYLSNLPRDDTLNIVHIIDISDKIVEDVRRLQKRYKNPLLGFLMVPHVAAAVITGMFAADSKNILKHIAAYCKSRNEELPFGDALEAYKSLYEIRNIYNQVSTSKSVFSFDLESFFYEFLQEWVIESGEKLKSIVEQALTSDKYNAINLEHDDKKHSSSVLDIFTLVKEYLRILKSLNWSNEYQLAKVQTTLLKSISDAILLYANTVTDKIIGELDEEEQKKLLELAESTTDKRKSGNWFDEMKSVVNNIQSGGAPKLEAESAYNFKPQTCVALNNLQAMMYQLSKLEDILDPENISNVVSAYEPSLKKEYTSHVFSLRLVKAENLQCTSGSAASSLSPYVTLIDTKARKTIGKTRTLHNTPLPEWDEEFEITLAANSSLTISVTAWDEKTIGSHSICGRALLQLDPHRFKHDGIPQEIYLDLDSQGRILLEVAVESERLDAIFVTGRAYRCLKRSQERCVNLIVAKFSRFIHYCFSRSNLRSICGSMGTVKPSQEQMDEAMMPLYNYLNQNLEVLAQYLTQEMLMKVMVAAWNVVVSSADELLLPKLASAKTFQLSTIGSKLSLTSTGTSGWQSAVSTAVASVSNSIGISGFGRLLTNNELETVFAWLTFLCFDFFHNNGNGPPIADLKNEHYQSLLLVPVYYDRDIEFLFLEVDRLSPAYVKVLRERNNFTGFETKDTREKEAKQIKSQNLSRQRALSRAGSLARSKTINAHATAKARERADREAQEARSDPMAAQVLTEDIILRLLLVKGEKAYVARRLDQRERLAHSIATERLARAAAEGRLG